MAENYNWRTVIINQRFVPLENGSHYAMYQVAYPDKNANEIRRYEAYSVGSLLACLARLPCKSRIWNGFSDLEKKAFEYAIREEMKDV